ncbi:MAG: fumarylacetoacetate hydrolase family protein [Chloroflexi bacterium]|nr:fumarylacetoacetate hydrolase family protein [Chloroflexota bacterium]
MRYYQFTIDGQRRLGVEKADGQITDLTSIEPRLRSTNDLFNAAVITGATADAVAEGVISRGASGGVKTHSYGSLSGAGQPGGGRHRLLPPIDAREVWAFGVTYMDSMRERQAESGTPDVYAKVYNAERPEAFFKATGDRVQPPFGDVGIRADSKWNVPEPELAFVVFDGRIVGYTAGNDMSSRTIEGENPLYLPQAKVYEKSVSFGPCLVTAESIGDPQKLDVTLTIERGGKRVFRGTANTSSMKRDCAYLADWLQRHNPVPDGTVALTGTGTIPPPDFTLAAGDVVSVEIEKIGTLVNTVVGV